MNLPAYVVRIILNARRYMGPAASRGFDAPPLARSRRLARETKPRIGCVRSDVRVMLTQGGSSTTTERIGPLLPLHANRWPAPQADTKRSSARARRARRRSKRLFRGSGHRSSTGPSPPRSTGRHLRACDRTLAPGNRAAFGRHPDVGVLPRTGLGHWASAILLARPEDIRRARYAANEARLGGGGSVLRRRRRRWSLRRSRSTPPCRSRARRARGLEENEYDSVADEWVHQRVTESESDDSPFDLTAKILRGCSNTDTL